MHSKGKNPTKKQKELLKRWKLNVDNWLIIKDLPDEMHVRHRLSGGIRIVRKQFAGGVS